MEIRLQGPGRERSCAHSHAQHSTWEVFFGVIEHKY